MGGTHADISAAGDARHQRQRDTGNKKKRVNVRERAVCLFRALFQSREPILSPSFFFFSTPLAVCLTDRVQEEDSSQQFIHFLPNCSLSENRVTEGNESVCLLEHRNSRVTVEREEGTENRRPDVDVDCHPLESRSFACKSHSSLFLFRVLASDL